MKTLKPYIVTLFLATFFTISCSDNSNAEIEMEEEQEEEITEVEDVTIPEIDFEIAKRYSLPDNFIIGNANYNTEASPINLLIGVVNKPIVDNSIAKVIPEDVTVTNITEEPITLKDELNTNNDCFLSTDVFTTKLSWNVKLVFDVNYITEVGETDEFNLLIDKKIVTAVVDPSDVIITHFSRKTKKGDLFEGCSFLNEEDKNDNSINSFKNTWNEANDTFSIDYIAYTDGVASRNLSYSLNKDKSGQAIDLENNIEYNWTSAGVITKTEIQ